MIRRSSLGWLLCLALVGSCGGDEDVPSEVDPEAPGAIATPTTFNGLDDFWSLEQANELLERSEPLVVDADLSGLSEAELAVVRRLVTIGEIAQRLYEESRHAEAAAAREHLFSLSTDGETGPRVEALQQLYSLFSGPIALTLSNERVPFAPVRDYEPGRNVYPAGTEREAFLEYVEAHPSFGLDDVRTVVRSRTRAQLEADRGTLRAHPWLRALHPELEGRLSPPPDSRGYYAVPYSLAYAEECLDMSRELFAAAAEIRDSDADLADYLEQRARDLLTNDYEAGDAAWISGRFGRLNAEVGAYETYDDHLLSQKAFFAVSILARADEESGELQRAVASLAEFEAALPGGPYGQVRTEIPVGIFDVVADFGQSRGGNTASILPNEAHITRKYGRTILIRRNIITNPRVLEVAQRRFAAAVHDEHHEELGERGNFDRTVWHEVGHYLGPKTTEDGRTVTEALGNRHNHIEEMKADLVSLWLMPRLVEHGILTEERMHAAYAAGILRTLVTTEPPRTSPYRTMQVMQQNWFLEHGVLSFEEGRLRIDYSGYHEAVTEMLTEVLAIQRAGDLIAANAFIDRWARWDEEVQGVLGQALDGVAPRFYQVSYPALSTLGE